MANEEKKDFNAMLHNSKDMPKMQIVTDVRTIERYGGEKMFFASPEMYDDLMRKVPKGKLTTVAQMREYFAKENGADFVEPMTAGIFTNIAAWAAAQRAYGMVSEIEMLERGPEVLENGSDITPFWRILKADGELNPKYPGAPELQKTLLEREGFEVEAHGKKFKVKDFEKYLVDFD